MKTVWARRCSCSPAETMLCFSCCGDARGCPEADQASAPGGSCHCPRQQISSEEILHYSSVTPLPPVPAAASPSLKAPSSRKVFGQELSIPVSRIRALPSLPRAREALSRDRSVTFHGMTPLCNCSFIKKLKGLRTG